jgi:hypothetical protein
MSKLDEKLDKVRSEFEMIKAFKERKESLMRENEELASRLEEQKVLREEKIKDKEVEKEKATDKLKKEMLEKIQATKTGRRG